MRRCGADTLWVGSRRDAALDGLRAVAVLAVVAHHAAVLPFALGTHGVDLFFVLSGMCLSLPLLRAGTDVDPKRFFKDRLTRIVPPYWAALAIYFALSFTAFGTPTNDGPRGVRELLSEALFYTGDVPTYDTSFWSLGVEACWYPAFPLAFVLYRRSKIFFALAALGAYAAHAFGGGTFTGALPCFMLGIVAADVYARGLAKHVAFVPAAALLLALAAFVDPGTGTQSNHGDPLWHLAAFATTLALAGRLAPLAAWRPLAFAGGASFSIYLVHQPIVFALGKHHVPLPLAALIAVAAGFAFWRAVEVPALAWRARLSRGNEKTRSVAAGLPVPG